MQVSTYNVINIHTPLNTESGKNKTATEEQNSPLSSSITASKQLDIALLLNTEKPLATDKRSDGMAVFDQLLTDAYRKLSEQFALPPELEAKMSEVKGYNDGTAVTAEKASNNILGFIERRLMLDKAEGATQAELETRLAAGLAGFEKGFAQAKEQLEALALLSPTIMADIGKTYDLVLSGIDKLKEKYLSTTTPAESNLKSNTQNTSATNSTKQSNISTDIAAKSIESSLSTANHLFAQSNHFSFDLKTLDGDIVTIRANAQEINAPKYGYERSSSFNLQISGELDEDELKAINDLLSQVNDLADTFFSGDMNKAFGEALNLGYNSEEIARFSLTLTHSEVQKIPDAYQQGNQATPLAQHLKPASVFAEQLLAAIDNAKHFGNPIELIQQLSRQVDPAEIDQDSQGNQKENEVTSTTQDVVNTDKSESSPIKFVDFVSLIIHSNNRIHP